jgi:hypothetical protein
MVAHVSATDIAFTMNAVMQGVFCGIWLLGSWAFGDVRRAALHWSAFAGLSTLSFLTLIVAMHQQVSLPAAYLRALGNLFSLAAMLALHRGVRLFIAAPLPTDAHALAFVIVLLVSWLGLTPAYAALRVSVNAAVLAAIALVIAADLYRYGRDVVRERHSWLLAVPLVAAAAGLSLARPACAVGRAVGGPGDDHRQQRQPRLGRRLHGDRADVPCNADRPCGWSHPDRPALSLPPSQRSRPSCARLTPLAASVARSFWY